MDNVHTSPKVSIVLPTHNGAKYIRQSIESCLNQTYKNTELIIVDDRSTDETSEIIGSYKDERIKYIRHQTNRRLPCALNTGFSNATGEYLTWTSDDNFYAQEAIEEMLSFLISKKSDFVYCNYFTFKDEDIDNSKLVELPVNVTFTYINCVRACFLYSRQIMESIGDYDPDTELAEDYDYWIRVSKKFSMLHFKRPLYYYRVHNDSLYSSKYWEQEVVKFLVRLKYDIMDINQTTGAFIRLLARKRKKNSRTGKFFLWVLFLNKIYCILNEFKGGLITFNKAKSDLNQIVNPALLTKGK